MRAGLRAVGALPYCFELGIGVTEGFSEVAEWTSARGRSGHPKGQFRPRAIPRSRTDQKPIVL